MRTRCGPGCCPGQSDATSLAAEGRISVARTERIGRLTHTPFLLPPGGGSAQAPTPTSLPLCRAPKQSPFRPLHEAQTVQLGFVAFFSSLIVRCGLALPGGGQVNQQRSPVCTVCVASLFGSIPFRLRETAATPPRSPRHAARLVLLPRTSSSGSHRPAHPKEPITAVCPANPRGVRR